jgi:hypothetical protein
VVLAGSGSSPARGGHGSPAAPHAVGRSTVGALAIRCVGEMEQLSAKVSVSTGRVRGARVGVRVNARVDTGWTRGWTLGGHEGGRKGGHEGGREGGREGGHEGEGGARVDTRVKSARG